MNAKVAAARSCKVSENILDDNTFTPALSTLRRIQIVVPCQNGGQIKFQGMLWSSRNMLLANHPPRPCVDPEYKENITDQILNCRDGGFIEYSTMTGRREDPQSPRCFKVPVTEDTVLRAEQNNAIQKPTCTDLEVEWVWWDGKSTWSLFTNNSDVKAHLSSQQLETVVALSDCKTSHCFSIGKADAAPIVERQARKKRQIDRAEEQRWMSERFEWCPYEIKNRPALSTGDARYDNGYTCEDYMNEWVVTWNSYAKFAGDVVDWQNRTSHDVLELYRLITLLQTSSTCSEFVPLNSPDSCTLLKFNALVTFIR